MSSLFLDTKALFYSHLLNICFWYLSWANLLLLSSLSTLKKFSFSLASIFFNSVVMMSEFSFISLILCSYYSWLLIITEDSSLTLFLYYFSALSICYLKIASFDFTCSCSRPRSWRACLLLRVLKSSRNCSIIIEYCYCRYLVQSSFN